MASWLMLELAKRGKKSHIKIKPWSEKKRLPEAVIF